jgi:hypothetical protein
VSGRDSGITEHGDLVPGRGPPIDVTAESCEFADNGQAGESTDKLTMTTPTTWAAPTVRGSPGAAG